MKIYFFLTIIIIIFEVFLRQINLLGFICLFYITIDILFWFKRYKEAFIIGFLSGVLIDFMSQDFLGKNVFSLFFPILIISFIDMFFRIESKLSKVIFSLLSMITSIFLHDFLFNLFMFKSYVSFNLISSRMLISAIIMLFIILIFQRVLLRDVEGSEKKLRSRYV